MAQTQVAAAAGTGDASIIQSQLEILVNTVYGKELEAAEDQMRQRIATFHTVDKVRFRVGLPNELHRDPHRAPAGRSDPHRR
jgi:hypothetical protein